MELAPRRQYTVSELTGEIAGILSTEFTNIWVSGEVSGLKVATSGHAYFTLKDAGAQIRCACWKGSYRLLRFKPNDGLAVLARGRVEVYEPRGEYQLIVELIEPVGQGALQLAFEQLKKRLEAEGLFSALRKRALPKLPQRIGIVTSPTGAVIRDFLNVIERRFPGLHVRLWPALVQGAGAAEQVVEGIRHFSEEGWAEVVVVARGGGSLEDLWTFNEEAVARAIFECSVPVISAIGHETDFTIADFVADLRAPTPSAAAEILTATREAVLDQIDNAQWRMTQALRFMIMDAQRRWSAVGVEGVQTSIARKINRLQQRVDDADFALRGLGREAVGEARGRWTELDLRLRRMDLRLRMAEGRRRLDRAEQRAAELMERRLAGAERRLEVSTAKLEQLSPLAILERGYAVVMRYNGQVIRDAGETFPGEGLQVRLGKGELDIKVMG
ncbi:MAG: exodeoxyribonuclease VII large subunit [Acidobacteriia bacterium 12-62-4]|nr:MAG: exodeoxyribonuclease VII large subunit [Acidobacteriia bacterium 12-62-4]